MNSTFIRHQRIHSELRSEPYLLTSPACVNKERQIVEALQLPSFSGEDYVAVCQVKMSLFILPFNWFFKTLSAWKL